MKLRALVASAAVLASSSAAQSAEQKVDVAVLYAGVADHPRTATWLEFLRRHCRSAAAIDMGQLSEAAAKDFDVVIIDSPSPYKDKGIELPRGPRLTRDFTRPTILLGAAGGSTLGSAKIKLDWL